MATQMKAFPLLISLIGINGQRTEHGLLAPQSPGLCPKPLEKSGACTKEQHASGWEPWQLASPATQGEKKHGPGQLTWHFYSGGIFLVFNTGQRCLLSATIGDKEKQALGSTGLGLSPW